MTEFTVEFLLDEKHPNTPFLLFTSGELDGIMVKLLSFDFDEDDSTLLKIDINIVSPGDQYTVEQLKNDKDLIEKVHNAVGHSVIQIIERALDENREDDSAEFDGEREVRS